MYIHCSSVENGMGKKYEYFINWDISSERNAKFSWSALKVKDKEMMEMMTGNDKAFLRISSENFNRTKQTNGKTVYPNCPVQVLCKGLIYSLFINFFHPINVNRWRNPVYSPES